MKKLYNQKTILSLIIMMIFLILSTIIFCICHKPIFYTTDSLRYINLDLIAHPYLVNVLDEQLTKKTLEKEGYTIFGANGKYSFSAGSASNDIWISLTVPTSSGSQETSGVSSAHYTTNVPYFKATVSGFNFDYYTVYVTITINHVTMINEEEGQLSSSKTSISTLSADGNTAFIDKRNGIAEFVVEAKNFDCTFKFTKNKSTSSSITYTITDDRRDTYGTSNSIPRDVSECLEQLIENQKTDDGKFSIVGYHQDNPSKWWDGEFAQCRSDYFVYSDEPVFYANFVPNTYTIKYDGNGATGGSTVSSSHTYDSSKNLTKNGFEKKGYHFVGWSTSKNDSIAYSDGQSVKNLTSTNGGTITLYAKWEPNTYTVKFNANGGSGSITNQSLAFDSVLNIPNPTKKGYKFTGWSVTSGLDATTAKSGTSNSLTELTKWDGTKTKNTYFANLTAKNNGTVELSAQWESYVLTYSFNSDGGSSHTGGTAYYGGTITLPTPTKTGYTFIGWKHNNNNKVYQAGGYSVNSDIANGDATVIFIAQWQANKYTINLNLQGGSGETSPIKATYDKVINIPNPTKTGYIFTGWSATSGLNKTTAKYGTSNSLTALTKWSGAATKNTYFANLTAAVNGAVTLTANWTAITYTIEFNSNDGSGNTQNQTFTYDSEKALSPNTFKWAGYIFKGWNTKSDGTGTSYLDKATVKNLTSIQDTTVTLYAQWEDTWANHATTIGSDETISIDGKKYLIIDSAEDLAYLSKQSITSSLTGNYIQTVDIDLSKYTWLPIGSENAFCGTYLGQGHKITGLKTSTAKDAEDVYLQTYGGLFGKLGASSSGTASAHIIGVHIKDCKNIYGQYSGAIAGYSDNSKVKIEACILENIDISGNTTASFVGNSKAGTIQDCLIISSNVLSTSNATTKGFYTGTMTVNSSYYMNGQTATKFYTTGASSDYSNWIEGVFQYPLPSMILWYPNK